jgi:hypothetical protein
MTKWKLALFSVVLLALSAASAQATIINVSGPLSLLGAAPTRISAPPDVRDDAAYNLAMQGFDERQGVTLLAPLAVDGGSIATGTRVSSHMIFLNTGPGNSTQQNGHQNVVWTFDGAILGVMSNANGSLEVASSPILGAAGTLYPAAPFSARGLESTDSYSFMASNQLKVNMTVTEPGDWIRVVTRAPEPSVVLLLAAGFLGFARRRRT